MTSAAILPPINLTRWIDDNRALLEPPVANKVVWEDADFICMVVGGPNQRTDFHYDEGPEFFYQLDGDMVLKIHNGQSIEDIRIREGEIFLLPAKVPHSPQRFKDTLGLVIERRRLEGEKDGLMWFCDHCEKKLYEEYFELTDIESQFNPVFERFYSDEEKHTCGACGHVNLPPA